MTLLAVTRRSLSHLPRLPLCLQPPSNLPSLSRTSSILPTAPRINSNFSFTDQRKHHLYTGISHPPPIDQSKQGGPEVLTLENGLRVISYPMQHSKNVATVGVWLDFGSRNESDDDVGVVHFLEHMTFKGTKTRDREDIERFVEQRGAHLNAYTTKEHVAYFANCLSRDAPDMLSLIFDLLMNSKLDVSGVESEKQVILREYQEVERINEEVLFDKIHEHVFGDTQLGRLILGTERQIALMTRPRLSKFMSEMYNCENMIVVVSGDHDLKKILSTCRSQGGGRRSSSSRRSQQPSYPAPEFKPGQEIFIDKSPDVLQTKPLLLLSVTTPGVTWGDPNFYSCMLMRLLLSNSTALTESLPLTGSRIKVPTSLPTVSTLDQPVFYDAYYKDCGLVGVYTSSEVPEDLIELWTDMGTDEALAMPDFKVLARELLSVIAGDFEERVKSLVATLAAQWTEEDVERAKENLVICFAQTLDSSNSAAEELGRQML